MSPPVCTRFASRAEAERGERRADWAMALPMVLTVFSALPAPAQTATRARIEPIHLTAEVSNITWVTGTTNGGLLVIADPTSPAPVLLERSRDGRERVLGRVGDGPGEYRSLDRVLVRRDTVLVFDRLRRRVTALALASGQGRSRHATITPPQPACRWQFELDARVGVCQEIEQDEAARVTTVTRLYRVHPSSPGGSPAASLLVAVPHDPVRALDTQAGRVVLTHWYDWNPRHALSPDGRWLAVLVQTRRGSNADVRVELHDLPRGTQATWRRMVAGLPLTRAARRTFVDRELATIKDDFVMLGRDPGGVGRRALERALALPDLFPPYTHLHVGDDGCVWLKRADTDRSEGVVPRFDVFTATGALRHALAVPGRIALKGVGCDTAHAVSFSPHGLQHLVRVMAPGS